MNAHRFKPQANDAIRDQLAKRRKQLQEGIRSALQNLTASNPKDMAGVVYDLKDESLSQMLRDVWLFDAHRDIQELPDIDQTLARPQAGTYGVCVGCGELIPVVRLQAYPTTRRWRPCQEIHEQQSTTPARSGA